VLAGLGGASRPLTGRVTGPSISGGKIAAPNLAFADESGAGHSHSKCMNGNWAGLSLQPAACLPGKTGSVRRHRNRTLARWHRG